MTATAIATAQGDRANRELINFNTNKVFGSWVTGAGYLKTYTKHCNYVTTETEEATPKGSISAAPAAASTIKQWHMVAFTFEATSANSACNGGSGGCANADGVLRMYRDGEFSTDSTAGGYHCAIGRFDETCGRASRERAHRRRVPRARSSLPAPRAGTSEQSVRR